MGELAPTSVIANALEWQVYFHHFSLAENHISGTTPATDKYREGQFVLFVQDKEK